MSLRILLSDDHDVVRQGVRSVLETEAGFEICGEAINGRLAISLAQKTRPDIVVIDVMMPDLNGIEAARQIRQQNPQTEVLIFTMHKTESLVRDALLAGAHGYVLKSDGVAILIQAIKALAERKLYFTDSVTSILLANYTKKLKSDHDAPNALTQREREILQLIAEGKSNKEIAAIVSISYKTVETHRASIMRKLEIRSTADLVRYAIRNLIIEP